MKRGTNPASPTVRVRCAVWRTEDCSRTAVEVTSGKGRVVALLARGRGAL